VIWSQILQLFHRNDHHIETTCRVQYLGCYREGQGHSMTLHQNRVWPKTLLFEVRFLTTFDKLLLCVQYLFGEHYPVPTGSCLNNYCNYNTGHSIFMYLWNKWTTLLSVWPNSTLFGVQLHEDPGECWCDVFHTNRPPHDWNRQDFSLHKLSSNILIWICTGNP